MAPSTPSVVEFGQIRFPTEASWSSWEHWKTAENIGKHLKSSDIILTTTEELMSRSPLICISCVFSVQINISTTGGFRVGFLWTWYQSTIILRGSMSIFAIGGPPGAKFIDTSHFGLFLRVSIEGWPQFTGPSWKILHLVFLPIFFLGVPIHVGKSGKNFGAKSQC